MAFTAALVEQTPFRLRYLLSQDGQAGTSLTIPNDGGATPDLSTDVVGGPLKSIIDLTGITQAEARARLNSDDAARTFLTNNLVGRAVCDLVPRLASAQVWAADVNVDGQGDPVVEIETLITGTSGCYLDIHFRHTPEL